MARFLVVIALVLAARTAHADPVVGVFGNYTHLSGIQAGGFGVDAELRVRRGRFQAFGEGAVAYLAVGAMDADQSGIQARVGAGGRWLARSFDDDEGTGFDLYIEAGVGVEGFWWAGQHVVRPDATFGWGWQVRTSRTVSLRSGLRALVANDREGIAKICRGCSSSPAEAIDVGMLAVMGMTW